ncbi:restriction endonuclease subunit S [Psittacicella hinzii]|uniref:Type I restriction modification DNA specificity domain-containing protein n=1 Tax=Psittacicella hinzii TaxID=2028575 RepID=A0A3A1YEU0_9GAMM|nr:restriction endonuclease subunit S [Psittacicella hinzii]RIY36753.1 hypothetical protein CKF58_05755 [Psittacicella hinzii]
MPKKLLARFEPLRRFKGFNVPWTEDKLFNLVKPYHPTNPHPSDLLTHEQGYPVFGANGYIGYAQTYNHDLPQVVVCARGNNAGKINLVNAPVWITANALVLQTETQQQLDKLFLYYHLHNNPLESYVTGGAQPQLTKGSLNNFKLVYPELAEQERIGKFLHLLLEHIELTQSKIQVWQEFTQKLRQLIFPQGKQELPSLRFKEFTQPWQNTTVKQIGQRFNNLRKPVTSHKRVPGTTPYYGSTGISSYIDGYTHDGEYILIAEDGASDLNNYPVMQTSGKIWVNNHAHVLQAIPEQADNDFLAQALKNVNYKVLVNGSSRFKLTTVVLDNIPLKVPHLDEQRKIGKLLSNLEQHIKGLEEFLAHLHKQRKALINELLTVNPIED